MLPMTPLLALLTFTPDGTAVFEGSYLDATGAPHSYTVDAETDGTITDSDGRTGSYSLVTDVTGGRVLTLDFGRLGVHTLYEGSSDCWAEPQPPVNPQIGNLATCLNTYDHRVVHYDTQGCSDVQTSPIFHTAALAQEDGHWMGGRLTPSSPNGFWVHDVTYLLNTSYSSPTYHCAAMDHRVQVFMGSAASSPPASPTVIYEETIYGTSQSTPWAELTVDLPAPLLVPNGQSLFVSIEMLDDGTDEVCAAMCGTSPGAADLTFWSDATTAPYSWYDLAPYGFYDIMVQAHGIAAGS